jgi:hypothetical protein
MGGQDGLRLLNKPLDILGLDELIILEPNRMNELRFLNQPAGRVCLPLALAVR